MSGACHISDVSTPGGSALETGRRCASAERMYDCARVTGQIAGEIGPKRLE